MSADDRPKANDAPPRIPLQARITLYEKYGEKIRPRMIALALARGAKKDRAVELAQRVISDFVDERRNPRIDPDDEEESLAIHLLGAVRSALDPRSREIRGRVKITTTGTDAVLERDGDGPTSAPGLVLGAPESSNPERLAERRDTVQNLLRELREEVPGDTIVLRMIDLLHLDLDARELAEHLGVPVLTIYNANRRLEDAKARLAAKKQKEKS